MAVWAAEPEENVSLMFPEILRLQVEIQSGQRLRSTSCFLLQFSNFLVLLSHPPTCLFHFRSELDRILSDPWTTQQICFWIFLITPQLEAWASWKWFSWGSAADRCPPIHLFSCFLGVVSVFLPWICCKYIQDFLSSFNISLKTFPG